jgi:uncharacterized protein (DUF885 family)
MVDRPGMAATATTPIQRIAEDFAEGVLSRSPTVATIIGDRRYDDTLPDIGPDGRERERKALEQLRKGLAAIDRSRLDDEDAITHHMLELAGTFGLATLDQRLYHLGLDQMGGPQVSLALLLRFHTLETEQNARDLLARFAAIPQLMEQYVGNLAEGVREGRTSPLVAYGRVVEQLSRLLATPPERSAYGQAAAKAAGPVREDLLGAVRDDVYPAFAGLLEYLKRDYARAAREQPGLWSIPGGDETYAELVRQVTQEDLTPQKVHDIGVEELRRIHDEMRALGVKEVRAYADTLKTDPRNHFDSRDELLEAAQRTFDRANAGLPRLFRHLPATPCEVMAIEEYREKDSVAAFYYPPSEDASRPGTFYVNTYRPETRPRYNLAALTVHEAVPGHHLQIAIQSEARGLPRFRRHRLGTHGALVAFTEGWGLYSERLGVEMDMYDTELDRFGMLSYQAWRAARLVVDTGIHALRWPRERAIRFLLENVGLPENEVVNEIDRYIVWPAQALAYKIGQRHIEALRRRCERALGARFDVRAFHDELLRHGAVPLSTASMVVERWLDRQ